VFRTDKIDSPQSAEKVRLLLIDRFCAEDGFSIQEYTSSGIWHSQDLDNVHTVQDGNTIHIKRTVCENQLLAQDTNTKTQTLSNSRK